MAGQLGVAFYGAGSIVQKRLANGARLASNCEVVGAYDPIEENAQKVIKEAGGKVYSSPADLLTDQEVAIVAIASPHHLHYEQTKAVLEAGKHPWVEKPAACHYKQVEELKQLALSKNKGYWVDSMMKNNWLNRKATEIVSSGGIGKVLRVETNMEFPYYEEVWPGAFNNFRYTETDEEGGGSAWDVGPHCLYMAMMFAGANKIKSVTAVPGPQMHKEVGVMQSCYFAFKLDNEVEGKSNTSFVASMPHVFGDLEFRIVGTTGRIEGHGTLFQHSFTGQENNDQHIIWHEGKNIKDYVYELHKFVTPEGAPEIYQKEFENFAQSILNGKPAINREALSLAGVIEVAIQAAKQREGVWRTVERFFN